MILHTVVESHNVEVLPERSVVSKDAHEKFGMRYKEAVGKREAKRAEVVYISS